MIKIIKVTTFFEIVLAIVFTVLTFVWFDWKLYVLLVVFGTYINVMQLNVKLKQLKDEETKIISDKEV